MNVNNIPFNKHYMTGRELWYTANGHNLSLWSRQDAGSTCAFLPQRRRVGVGVQKLRL